MIYYKSCRLIGSKAKWIIIDDDYNKILDPTKDQLRLAILGDPPRKCCICREIYTYVYASGYEQWHDHKCDKNNCTGYLCNKCRSKKYYHNVTKFDSNSHENWKKSVRKFRNKQLDPKTESGKGFIGEMIVANTRGLKNCNLELDNFNSKFDLSFDHIYGKIQVKTASLINGEWRFNTTGEQEYDTIFLICMGDNWKNVERMYAIPWEVAVLRKSIVIYKNPSKGIQQYEEFRVDEKPFDKTYHKMKLEDCPVLKKDKKKKDV